MIAYYMDEREHAEGRTRVTISLSPEVFAALESFRAVQRRTRSNMIEMVLCERLGIVDRQTGRRQ